MSKKEGYDASYKTQHRRLIRGTTRKGKTPLIKHNTED